MRLKNAYKKAKKGSIIKSSSIPGSHVVGMRDGGKYLPTAVSQELARKKEGGKIDHSNDADMVNGVASILRRVKDKKNRLQLANQLSNQFNREKVRYNLSDFLSKSKVKK